MVIRIFRNGYGKISEVAEKWKATVRFSATFLCAWR